MKIYILLFFLSIGAVFTSSAQDEQGIERAALDYIEGFYYGDTTKIIRSIHPDLSKDGYKLLDAETNSYKTYNMTFEKAVNFARDVLIEPKYGAPEGAPKTIEILDAQDKIACVKITVYWGIDYLLLVKYGDKWMISKVLWQKVEHD